MKMIVISIMLSLLTGCAVYSKYKIYEPVRCEKNPFTGRIICEDGDILEW